ncbi:MAG: adenylate/guanylate cyclase domain-containing protein [Betaproteobacteria bacterium]|nr:adenylate/guanylate cyclase domain-containing protein [Betaproteobacteria bacterium]MDH4294103.1 adenylate/guanylate cyclase domain-containing protein [Betaproteobacteria bacterium]
MAGGRKLRVIMSDNKNDHLAVLFADVAESTELYREIGDVEALQVISACLTQLISVLPQHQGRLVKTMGDAIMCLFPDSDSAVEAAVDMQRQIDALQPGGRSLQIRIGLHTGPVVVGGDDVYGDTVNVAAYLGDAATPGQILIAEATAEGLRTERRTGVRPIFDAVLKATLAKTPVCEVQWRDDVAERTHINLQISRTIPEDAGSLLLTHGHQEHRVDHWHSMLVMGRDAGCNLVVPLNVVSRRHAAIRIERTQFYLVDHSINGTFVTRANGEEVHVMRREIMLDVRGEIRLGYSRSDRPVPLISFRRDRRSIYRV